MSRMNLIESLTEAVRLFSRKETEVVMQNMYAFELVAHAGNHIRKELKAVIAEERAESAA